MSSGGNGYRKRRKKEDKIFKTDGRGEFLDKTKKPGKFAVLYDFVADEEEPMSS